MIVKCNVCGGVYPTVQFDGTKYTHVCPPEIEAKDARNENPPSTAESHGERIIAPGKGTTEVT